MSDIIRSFPQPPDDERRRMSPEVAERLMNIVETTPLVDETAINNLATTLDVTTRLDGWTTVKGLIDCLVTSESVSTQTHDLFWGDLNLLRPCLGSEHAVAVMDAGEIDYLPAFYEPNNAIVATEVLKINRWCEMLQDSGKVLAAALDGDNFGQSKYNQLIARNILGGIYDSNLSPAAKQATLLLIGQDIVGGILQKCDVAQKLTAFREAWPAEFATYRDDLLLASYLSDASAHSSYRLYRNARNGHIEPAVRPEDAQLSFLFERHLGGALTLTQDRCQLLADALPDLRHLRYLLTNERSPYAREDTVFQEILWRKLASRAVGELCLWRDPDDDGIEEDVISVRGTEKLGLHATIYRHHGASRTSLIGHVTDETIYHMPGDGRVWCRFNQISAGMPFALRQSYPLRDAEYIHTDPEVTAMQKGVALTFRNELEDIGYPLSGEEAWQAINRIESIS